MKILQLLNESLKIAANRSATQVASIIIVGLLGAASTELLAAFSLALSAAAIFFVANTAIQYGLQAELSKSMGAGNHRDLFGVFFAGLWFMIALSVIAIGIAYFSPNPFDSISESGISNQAFLAYQVLVLSLPIVAIHAGINFLLEAYQKITLVFRLRMLAVALQIVAVIWVLHANPEPQAYEISLAYLATDVAGLLTSMAACLFYIDRKAFFRAARASLRFITERQIYFRALKSGGSVAAGAVSQKYLFFYVGLYSASLGATYASAFAILNSIIFLLLIPVTGVSQLATIKLSFACGAKNSSMLLSFWKVFRKLFLWIVITTGVFAWLALPWMISLFSQDTMVASHISGLGYLFLVFYLMNCSFNFLLSMLRGLSDIFYPQLMVNISMLLMIIPVLKFIPGVDFPQVIGLFCLVEFWVAAGLIARWRKKLGDMLAVPDHRRVS